MNLSELSSCNNRRPRHISKNENSQKHVSEAEHGGRQTHECAAPVYTMHKTFRFPIDSANRTINQIVIVHNLYINGDNWLQQQRLTNNANKENNVNCRCGSCCLHMVTSFAHILQTAQFGQNRTLCSLCKIVLRRKLWGSQHYWLVRLFMGFKCLRSDCKAHDIFDDSPQSAKTNELAFPLASQIIRAGKSSICTYKHWQTVSIQHSGKCVYCVCAALRRDCLLWIRSSAIIFF